MKKNKNPIDWLSVLLIGSLSMNFVISLILYIKEKQMNDLIMFIVTFVCLIAYLIILILVKNNKYKEYFIVYNDCFIFDKNNILNSEYTTRLADTTTNKYNKYDFKSNLVVCYEFKNKDYLINFDLIEIDDDRKLMIVKNKKYFGEDELLEYVFFDLEDTKVSYYENNKISPIDAEYVKYINKRNAYAVCKENDKYKIVRYRHYPIMVVYKIKDISSKRDLWDIIPGENDGLLFDTLESAIEHLNFDDLLLGNKKLSKFEYVLDSLINDDECATQIMEYFEFVKCDITKDELEELLDKMVKSGYLEINHNWKNEKDEYPYSLTEAGKTAWSSIEWDD